MTEDVKPEIPPEQEIPTAQTNSSIKNENAQNPQNENKSSDATSGIKMNPHLPNPFGINGNASQFQYDNRSYEQGKDLKMNPHGPNSNYFYK